MNLRFLELPDDLKKLIINKLEKDDLLNLIEVYPELQVNEALWQRMLYGKKYIKQGSFYITYFLSLPIELYSYEITVNDEKRKGTYKYKDKLIKKVVKNLLDKVIINNFGITYKRFVKNDGFFDNVENKEFHNLRANEYFLSKNYKFEDVLKDGEVFNKIPEKYRSHHNLDVYLKI